MTPADDDGVVAASFRDPTGFLFRHGGTLYRQINHSCREDYDHLLSSGLYATLTKRNQLIPHNEVGLELARSDEAYRIIQPQLVDFISYTYEWCFRVKAQFQLKQITGSGECVSPSSRAV